MTARSPDAIAVMEGRHSDPFRYLGPHLEDDGLVLRVFLPDAEEVAAIDENGRANELQRIHPRGLFAGRLAGAPARYQLRARFGHSVVHLEDAYRFPAILSEFDLYLLGEGTHLRLYDKLGAHVMTLDGVSGVGFVVFAPNAKRVSVVGDFNFWDGRRHAMRLRGNGYWEIFVPGAQTHDRYKYEIIAADGRMLPLKADPVAFAAEVRPKTGSIVFDINALPRPAPAAAKVNLSGTGARTAGLCGRSRLHARRVYARERASIRRLVGLSADGDVCADQPVRRPGRFCRAGGCLSSGGPCGAARLGAGALPG